MATANVYYIEQDTATATETTEVVEERIPFAQQEEEKLNALRSDNGFLLRDEKKFAVELLYSIGDTIKYLAAVLAGIGIFLYRCYRIIVIKIPQAVIKLIDKATTTTDPGIFLSIILKIGCGVGALAAATPLMTNLIMLVRLAYINLYTYSNGDVYWDEYIVDRLNELWTTRAEIYAYSGFSGWLANQNAGIKILFALIFIVALITIGKFVIEMIKRIVEQVGDAK